MSSLKSYKNFQSPISKDKPQKKPTICNCCRFSEDKLYLYHSTKIAKAGPGFDDWPKHPSVQIYSSNPCLIQLESITFVLFF